MRLLIATGIYPPDIGGPATYAAQLFERLPKYGIEVRIITYADEPQITKNRNYQLPTTLLGRSAPSSARKPFRFSGNYSLISISRELPKGIRHLFYFFKVLWHGREADIIYALDTVSAGLPAAMAAKILRKPFVVKVVGDYAWEQEQLKQQAESSKPPMASLARLDERERGRAFGGQEGVGTIEDFRKQRYGFVTEMRRTMQQWVVRSARTVVTPSEYLKTIIAGWGITREKIAVVPNAVIVPEVDLPKEEARMQLGLHGTILLSAGRLVPWKGFRTLITMMREIKKQMPEAQLFIIGSGPEGESLKAYVRGEALEANVKFMGSVPHDTLWQYLKASDIFLLNTAYEGFSHQIIEAMAAGVPVLTTAIGGNPEIIEDGKEGLLVPCDDAETFRKRMSSLLEDKKKYTEIQEQAKEKAKQFSLQKMIERTIIILES